MNPLSKRIYIAGKISELSRDVVVAKFEAKANELRALGYEVINPVNECEESWAWEMCMRICLCNMLTCGEIYMLPCWEDSKGAKIEHRLATEVGMKITYQLPLPGQTKTQPIWD